MPGAHQAGYPFGIGILAPVSAGVNRHVPTIRASLFDILARYKSSLTSALNLTPLVGAHLYQLSPADAYTVALKPRHRKITRQCSRYCAVTFCCVHKCVTVT